MRSSLGAREILEACGQAATTALLSPTAFSTHANRLPSMVRRIAQTRYCWKQVRMVYACKFRSDSGACTVKACSCTLEPLSLSLSLFLLLLLLLYTHAVCNMSRCASHVSAAQVPRLKRHTPHMQSLRSLSLSLYIYIYVYIYIYTHIYIYR